RLTDLAERVGRVLQREGAAIVARRRDDDEGEVRLADRLLVAHGGADAVAVRGDQVVEAGFLDRRPSLVHRVDRWALQVDHDVAITTSRNRRSYACDELPEPDDRYALRCRHSSRPSRKSGRPPDAQRNGWRQHG